MWWWIEPLWCTGAILILLSGIWIAIFKNSEKFWPVVILFVLWSPMIAAGASIIIWALVQVFQYIWGLIFNKRKEKLWKS